MLLVCRDSEVDLDGKVFQEFVVFPEMMDYQVFLEFLELDLTSPVLKVAEDNLVNVVMQEIMVKMVFLVSQV